MTATTLDAHLAKRYEPALVLACLEIVLDFGVAGGLAGGLLIGTGAGLLLIGNGRIAGASGIVRDFLGFAFDGAWLERAVFLAGLILAPLAYASIAGAPMLEAPFSAPVMALGGLLVGVGVAYANGCTSGHGVCGLSRFSTRSLAATVTFMATAAATVFLVRHVVGA